MRLRLLATVATLALAGPAHAQTAQDAAAAKQLQTIITTLQGIEATLAAPPVVTPIIGVCGPANGVTVAAAPTTGRCAAGTASAVASTASAWTWSCAGAGGGASASCSAPVTIVNPPPPPTGVQDPGPSAALFASPYYACVRNFYVSLTGSDTAAGTQAAPWATLQHANDVGRQAGDCVNALPGTYTHGVMINSGGNLASSTGYVVYRCTVMDACTVTDVSAGGQNGSFVWNTTPAKAGAMGGSYVIIDGFTLAASAATLYGQGIDLWNGGAGFVNSVHHVWVLNSIISGYGQSGVQMNDGEYFYLVHNEIKGNAGAGCDAQGSGISYNNLKALTGYTPTPDDLSNSVTGPIGPGFHNAVLWNHVHNNAMTTCGSAASPYDTDGNNIIMDVLDWPGVSGASPYLGGVLIAFNVVYNSGGGGIHVNASTNITVANNSCYNSYLDPFNNGSSRACIDETNGYGDTFINNIAVSIPTPVATCGYQVVPYTMWNNAFNGSLLPGVVVNGVVVNPAQQPDVFSHNIAQTIGKSCGQGVVGVWNGDTLSATANKIGISPGWVAVGQTSPGTEMAPPVGTNFALAPGSAAIGYGLAESYLPASAVDAGACSSTFKVCP